MSAKEIIGIALTPLQLNQIRSRRHGTQIEIIEEGSGQPDNISDP